MTTRCIHGVSCSAHLSTRGLPEAAQRKEKKNVANALKHCFYVYDFLGAFNSIEEVETLIQDLLSEFLKYGFPLRKGSSIDPALILNLSTDLREGSDNLKLFPEVYKVKALGISLISNKDTFSFKCSLDERLSAVAFFSILWDG